MAKKTNTLENPSQNLNLTSDTPKIKELIRQFKMDGYQGEYWGRMRDYEDTRFCYWSGQSNDGKKHSENLPEGEKAFPWEGANDSRVYLSDEICNEMSAMMADAFWRADLRVVPVGTEDMNEASIHSKAINWLKKSKLSSQLSDEVELAAQYTVTHGWCGLDVSWDREIGFREQEITLEELTQVAEKLAQAGDQDLGEYLNALRVYADTVQLPEAEDSAIELTQILYSEQIRIEYPELADEIKGLSNKKARKIVRDLRNTGRASINVPYLCKNEPCIAARKPYRDIVIPYETAKMDGSVAVFIREYMTEDAVRSNALSEGWDENWVEEVIKTKGRETVWHSSFDSEKNPTYLWRWEDRRNEFIEIVRSYKASVDSDGVRAVYMTVFSPHLEAGVDNDQELYGLHVDLGLPDFPIIDCSRERVDRSIVSSRGIPELTVTNQREEKVLRDAVVDRASIEVLPPVLNPRGAMGKEMRFGPATNNIYKPGHKPEFMQIGGSSINAVEHIRINDERTSRYFGRFVATNPPALSQLLMGPPIRRFLNAWARALKTAYIMCLKFAPEMIERVTGQIPHSAKTLDLGDYDFIFKFDSANLNPDLQVQKLEAFSKLLLEDQDGVIIKSKLTAMKARLIDPDMADDLIEDPGTASENLFRKVQTDLSLMFTGNEVLYADASNDPTARAKANYFVQILSKNPKYIQSLDPRVLGEIIPEAAGQPMQNQPDPLFSAYVKKYWDNLQQGVAQQQNKVTGRTGVK